MCRASPHAGSGDQDACGLTMGGGMDGARAAASGGRPNGPRLVAGPVRAMLAAAHVAYLGSYLETVKTG